MRNKNTLVTSYESPDLDGVACAFAYAEFLHKNDKQAIAAIFGTPHREAVYVTKKFNITALPNAELLDYDDIILVDASELVGISKSILPEKVIEVIDHRKINDAHKFVNAILQIEFVGSAATLIAEKFYKKGISISKESAALLFSAIVSNTINFKANVTTKRDHEMADWLKTKFPLPKNYIKDMFADKSEFKKPLKDVMEEDLAIFSFNKYRISILQLEIINAEDFIINHLTEIKEILKIMKKENSVDLIFLTCIDLDKGFNIFVAVDKTTQSILSQALNIEFKEEVTKRIGILMRKEISPILRKFIEK